MKRKTNSVLCEHSRVMLLSLQSFDPWWVKSLSSEYFLVVILFMWSAQSLSLSKWGRRLKRPLGSKDTQYCSIAGSCSTLAAIFFAARRAYSWNLYNIIFWRYYFLLPSAGSVLATHTRDESCTQTITDINSFPEVVQFLANNKTNNESVINKTTKVHYIESGLMFQLQYIISSCQIVLFLCLVSKNQPIK